MKITKEILLYIIIVILLGILVWQNLTHIQDIKNITMSDLEPIEKDTPNNSAPENIIPTDWIQYNNTELHFSFYYPKEFGYIENNPWDTDEDRTGNEFGVVIKNDMASINFGASSPDYKTTVARGGGFIDQVRNINSFVSNEYYKVTGIQSNGISGKFIEGTDQCVTMCLFATDQGPISMYGAIFPIPKNAKGLEVIGFQSFKVSKNDFLKIISTFKII